LISSRQRPCFSIVVAVNELDRSFTPAWDGFFIPVRSENAFDRGLGEHLPRLRRFALSLSRNAADADDLTQQTLEKALRARNQWEAGTRLDSWLYRIMRNAWVDTRRARARASRMTAPEEEGVAVGADPRPALEAGLELARIRRAMNRLPDDQRLAVALVLVEGCSYEEAAAILNIPVGTLSSRLVRGRAALLTLLGGA
jgi:RNA polymerase sigma factor (sigma-70 family)